MRAFLLFLFFSLEVLSAQTYLLKPDRVFDGVAFHDNWNVLVENEFIKQCGPASDFTPSSKWTVIELTGKTLMPGMIEGHSHILLHPYNETSWNDQVLRESLAERVARAVVHCQKSLEAGFTTMRDLGSEGADYADVGIRQAIEKGIIPGPRLLVAGKAIVAKGSYGPKGFAPNVKVPLGAEEAGGHDNLIEVVRDQIGHDIDLVKVYADYRWGLNGEARPTFTVEELKTIVEIANSSGRDVVAHASTEEGMRRAILAGVATIEHGDGGTASVFQLMKEKGVALCPTLAAGDAILQYQGWDKTKDPAPSRITLKKASFKNALAAGVTIVAGGDVGVFTHGDNVRELELMVEYGMKPIEVLQSVTSINAKVFHLDEKLGMVKPGFLADLIAVEGNLNMDIRQLRSIAFVMKNGKIEVDK